MFRDRFEVEAICRTLGVTQCGFLTARGYRAAKTRPVSDRAVRDGLLGEDIIRLHADNYGVYGVRKMHALMRRQGWAIGRDQTGRVMRQHGIAGARRSRRIFTTKSDPAAVRPADLVQRRFVTDAPCRLWVSDITYVVKWSGFAYVAFLTDVYARRMVGWNVSGGLKTELFPVSALDMAAWFISGDLTGLIHDSDRGSNYVSLVHTDRVIEFGADRRWPERANRRARRLIGSKRNVVDRHDEPCGRQPRHAWRERAVIRTALIGAERVQRGPIVP